MHLFFNKIQPIPALIVKRIGCLMTKAFNSLSEFRSIVEQFPTADDKAYHLARERNAQLTKPAGSLGRLEDIAVWYASWRGRARPTVNNPQVVIFAGNHGVTSQGVSVFPTEVTAQMVINFEAGGAAINQLTDCFGASLDVHALHLELPTLDFTKGAAMSEADCVSALYSGWSSVDEKTDLLVAGEMGIGNTTSTAAIALALFGGSGTDWAGKGTGLDVEGVALKARIVEAGLAANPSAEGNGLKALMCLGGRELAAMAGAIARARSLRIPVILDGFICCAAAACLHATSETALDHCVAGHQSAERAHQKLLKNINKDPLLSLGLRLGEGSGAALAISVVKAAVACHSFMATFADAGVSQG